jgi:hypothetical protein
MGLDNGIIIKGKTPKGVVFLDHFHEDYGAFSKDAFAEAPGVYEIIYLRKCWNIRNRAADLGLLNDCSYDEDRVLSVSELNDIVELFKYFLNEDNWYDDGESIWDWFIMLPTLAEAIRDICFFLREYEDSDVSEDDFEITFYDSY